MGFTLGVQDVAGIRRRQHVTVAGPASYVTGGQALVPNDVSLGVIDIMPGLLATNGSAVRLVVYDYTTQKLIWYVPDTGAEVANGTDLSEYEAKAEVVGY